MQQWLKRTLGVDVRLSLVLCAVCGWVGLTGCSSPLGKVGDACNVYAEYPTKCPSGTLCSGDCTQGLQCSCEPGGCFCATACGGDGGLSCPGTSVCHLGHNAVDNSTGFYCFPQLPDAGI